MTETNELNQRRKPADCHRAGNAAAPPKRVRTTPGSGRDRETTPTAPSSRSATDGTNENKADTSGLRGEIGSSQSRCKGSLSASIVPIESRGTEKRRDPGSRVSAAK